MKKAVVLSVDVRFAANGFVKIDSTLQTSRSNNKRDRDTFMLIHLSLTLKKRFKVKSDITKRFEAYDFQKVDCTLQTSGTNNNRGKNIGQGLLLTGLNDASIRN